MAAVLATGAHADEPTPASATDGTVVLGVFEPVTVAAGESSTVHVPLRVADGHRVQANPASNEFLVPLELDFTDPGGFVIGEPTYPLAEIYLLEGSDEPLLTYSGEFEVVVPVAAADDLTPGDHMVPATLHYQACNSRMCLFPESIQVELWIEVLDSEKRAQD